MKRRELKELQPFWLKFSTFHRSNGRRYQMECANQEGILQNIQSIPSPKAEPFKRWLAMTGSRRLDEMKKSQIEIERERLRLLGFSEKEIQGRLDGLLIADHLNQE